MNAAGKTSPCPTSSELQAYLDRDLNLPDRVPLERHLRKCDACRTRLTQLTEFLRELDEVGQPIGTDTLRPEQKVAVMKRIARSASSMATTTSGDANKSLWHRLEKLFSGPTRQWAAGVAFGLVVLVSMTVFWRFATPDATSSSSEIRSLPAYILTTGGIKVVEDVSGAQVSGELRSDLIYRTSGSGRIDLVCADQAISLQLDKKARFQLAARGVSLFSGRVRCDIGADGRGFEVKTPFGTVVTKGTLFEVDVTPEHTHVLLRRGVVLLQTPHQVYLLERPGERYFTERGAIVETSGGFTSPDGGPAESTPQVSSPQYPATEDHRPPNPRQETTGNSAATGLSHGY